MDRDNDTSQKDDLQLRLKELESENEGLRRSQEIYRDLVENSYDWYWEVDQHCVYTYVSSRAHSLLGYEPSEMIGKTPFDFMSPDESEHICSEFWALAGERRPISLLENTLVHKDGHLVTVDTCGIPIVDDKDNLQGYRGTDRDVTERKRTEQALWESVQMLKLVMDTIPVHVFWKDANSVFLGCNGQFAIDAGLTSPEEIVGKTDFDLPWTREEAESYRTDDREVIETGIPRLEYEEAEHAADGRAIWVRTSKVPLRDASGRAIGVLGTFEDITERKETELALRESEQKYRNLVETTATGYLILDVQGRVIDANAEYAKLTGRHSLDEILGHSVLEWTVPYDLDRNGHELAKCIESGFVRDLDIDYISPEGRITPIEINATVMDTADGPRILTLCRDVSDRRQVEEALRAKETLLRQFVEHTPAAVAMFDRDICYLLYSRRWMIDYKLGDRDITGLSHYEVFPDIPDRWKEIHQRVLAGSVERCEEDAFVREDGSVEWIRWEVHPWRNDSGEIGGIIMFTEVITERKRTSVALQDSEQRYKSLIQKIQAAVIVHGADTRIVTVNPLACQTFGLTEDEMLGKGSGDPVWRLLREDGTALPVEDYPVNRVMATREPLRSAVTGVLRPGRGEPVWVLVNADPVFDDGGAISEVIVTFVDISERKQAAEALLRRGRQLEILSSASRSLNAVLDIPVVMRTLVASAMELVDAEAGAGGVCVDGKLVFTEYNSRGQLVPISYTFDPGYGVPGWVAQTMKTYVCNDAEHDPHVIPEVRKALGFHNLVDIPVVSREGRLLGAFEIHNTANRRPFDEIDVSMLEGLAANAAVAFENAELIVRRIAAEEEQRALERSVEEQKRQFYRETIQNVTQGKLNLVGSDEIEDYLDSAELTMNVSSSADTTAARHEIIRFCAASGLGEDRRALFETAVGEAMTNAVKHANEGEVYAGARDHSIWVAISDNGPGISTLTLPGATLRTGFSTRASMGLGYSIMMEAADRILLCTGPQGTTVVLSVEAGRPRQPVSLDDLPDTWETIPDALDHSAR